MPGTWGSRAWTQSSARRGVNYSVRGRWASVAVGRQRRIPGHRLQSSFVLCLRFVIGACATGSPAAGGASRAGFLASFRPRVALAHRSVLALGHLLTPLPWMNERSGSLETERRQRPDCTGHTRRPVQQEAWAINRTCVAVQTVGS